MHDHKKILVIQTAFLGDVILITPLLRALKEVFPESEIDVLTIPETGIVFKYNPCVHEVLHFDKRQFTKKSFSFIKLIVKLRKNNYDLAISIQSSLTSSLLMLLSGINVRVGFQRQKLLTIPVRHKRGMHIRDRYLALMQPFSNQQFDNQTELFWSLDEEQKAQQIIEDQGKQGNRLIGIAPGSVWNTKKWLQQYFETLINRLTEKRFNIFLIGGPGDQSLCESIITKSNTDAINLAGKLSVLESAALIEKLDLMITNDSAPLHIANAVKTDVFAIFGPTVRRFGCYPFREHDKMLEIDLYCRPCSKHGGKKCPEKHFQCMKNITPEFVSDEVISYFKRINRQ